MRKEIAKQLPPVGPRLCPIAANPSAMAFAVGPNATDDWTKPLAWIDAAAAKEAASRARPARATAGLRNAWDKAEVELLAAELDALSPAK